MLGIGQIALDQVGIATLLPKPAGKARMHSWQEHPGGQIATAVLTAARLGRRTAFVGTVGDDPAADLALAPLAAAAVDLGGVRRVPGASTQSAMIWIDAETGERTVFWHREPALTLEPADLPKGQVASAGVLLIDAGDPSAALAAARAARKAGRPVVLDADGDADGLDPLLAACDFPILSAELARSRFGAEETAASELAAAGARLAIVTLGRDGALASDGERLLRAPGLRLDAVDTTGAGDAFHGAFCDALLSQLGAEGALAWSNATAGLNCTGRGAQGGLPNREEVERALGTRSSRRRSPS